MTWLTLLRPRPAPVMMRGSDSGIPEGASSFESGAPGPSSTSRLPRRLLPGAILALVVGGALVLRFLGLPSQGFGYWDEAQYSLEGRFLADL